MDVGARVWVADAADESVWLAARVLEVRQAAVTVELENQREEEPVPSRFKHRGSYDDDDASQSKRRDVTLTFGPAGDCINVLPRNMPREQDQRDLVALPHLHEASILNALRLRYERHAIYTHIGDILISINPFQDLPQLYGDEILQGYAYDHNSQFGDRITTTDPREPHLFAVARAAYMDIVQNARSQSILISGESGAGKTEATKIIMTYFAVHCGTGNNLADSTKTESTSPPASPSRTTIEEQVLQSNPILEAFGNARTVRNDNSSRFGKFIELRFRDERRKLAGARIRTYLLEKIRVIKQAPHERNFHIFYELLSADNNCVSKEQKQVLALSGGPQSFRLLNQSLCSKRRDGVKDGVQFRSTKRAMQQLGMSEREIGGVLEIVAAVLHMGNVDFEQVPHKREDNVFADEARVATSTTGACNHFTKAAELLGVSTEALDHALTKRWLHASNETLVVGVDVAHARNTRNALTMECYRLLFEWLVARVNNKLQRQASAPWDADENDLDDEEDSTDFIGLLDIFGFEDMAENSFEQLCINYANEALQHQFNQYVFEEEQRLYRDEGIRWSFVDFPNNRACLELFEHRPIGIFSLTDQECVFPQGTDRALVAKYYLEFEKKKTHPHFCSAPVIQRATQFVVAHYAGCVTYTVDGFLAKNKDSFCESAAQLLAGSSNPLIQALAAGSTNEDGTNGDSELDGFGGRTRRRAKSAIAAVSVGTQFKIQLNELLSTVRATTPRYVRCIKPNDSHVGSLFQSTRVVEQLRSGGVLEAVRVARAGFPVRLSHKQFLGRYRRVLLSLYKWGDNDFERKHRSWSELDLCLHQLTQVLLAGNEEVEGGNEDEDDEQDRQMRCGVSLGKTRVFFRRKPYEKLENLRVAVRQRASLVVQRHARGFVARRSYIHLRQTTVAMQARVRGRRAYRHVCWMRAMQQARVLQARMRQLCARSRFLRARAGVLAVQCRFRCRLATRVVQALREARAVTRIATAWRRSSAQRKYRKLCSATLALQCAMRARTAKRVLKVLREESRNVAKLKEDNAQLKDELAELRRQMQVMVAQSASKERQQLPFPSFKTTADPAHKSPQKAVMFSSENGPAEDDNNQRDCENQLELELSDDLVTGGNPNAADGRDVGCVVDLSYSQQKPKLQTPNSRRTRQFRLPPTLEPANEDAEQEETTLPASPRASRSRDRRHSLDLWRLQEAEAQKEVVQLREEIREAAADEPSPERQQQQEIALQKLVASQIKRKTMELQLQLPEFELKVDNNSIDAGPASCISHQRRSRTVDSPLRIPAPLTSCGRQVPSRWNFAAPHSMTHATSGRMPAYFDSPNYDDRSVDGDDDLYGRGRHPMPRRSASTGMYRTRSSSNSSSCYAAPSVTVRPGVVVPRFAKAPTCYECDCTFNLLVRRHHCRQCGNSFCFEHSTRQLALPHLGYMAAQRVCDTCFEEHIQAMTSLKLPSLMRNPTDELSSFASSPRGLESNDSDCGFDSPTEVAARVTPLRT
ncbi:Myosin-17 [Phytophthora cactorum]|nr:Myosin-17 [Phytophthora cactorum]